MKKENRQIEWVKSDDEIPLVEGYYKGKNIIDLLKKEEGEWEMYFTLNQVGDVFPRDFYHRVRTYTTLKDAKRGAERFLRRLQEAVK